MGGPQSVFIFDVSDPRGPVSIGYFETADRVRDLEVRGEIVYVADREAGLRLYHVSDPKRVLDLTVVESESRVTGVTPGGGLIYVAPSTGGVGIFKRRGSLH